MWFGKNMEEVVVVVELITKLHEEELDEVNQMIKTPDFFNKLVDSMAPTVFGHQDIKRAILLMLLGGVHMFTHEGINIRGHQFSRSFYTSGKSTYVVGLAATVAKEPETGEFCIEILVL
uniref:MCM C-terminal AAA(+) ATPase domain-containing protein n=1 Tax=Lactuca sativa TaxID=4236 RepID=A0A9R1XF48_LACSA|nr:hypothetical protein LSAT_V11C400209470 [Lactuca sativa]